MTNHPNRSKQQQTSAFPYLLRRELEELCLRQNQRVEELLAALNDLCNKPKDKNQLLERIMRGRAIIAKCEGR